MNTLLSKTITALRLSRGLTPKALWLKARVSASALYKLENRPEVSPRLHTLTSVAAGLGLPLSEILRQAEGTTLRRRDPSLAEKCATAAALERGKPRRRRSMQTAAAYARLAEAANLFRA